jgi:hypothetical protein
LISNLPPRTAQIEDKRIKENVLVRQIEDTRSLVIFFLTKSENIVSRSIQTFHKIERENQEISNHTQLIKSRAEDPRPSTADNLEEH